MGGFKDFGKGFLQGAADKVERTDYSKKNGKKKKKKKSDLPLSEPLNEIVNFDPKGVNSPLAF